MSHLDQKQSWRQRLAWLAGELLVVFAGVSAAFVVASGITRMLEPSLRWDLGYSYSEFVGVHDNYVRYNEFTEREVLPKALSGPDAFYGSDGRLLSPFRAHMDLQKKFAEDLHRLSSMARDLRVRLEAVQSSK
jgi:hypothetical protein